MSMVTRSGFSSRKRLTAWTPSSASPATANPALVKMSRSVLRMNSASSTISTRLWGIAYASTRLSMARCKSSGSISISGPSAESACAQAAPDGSLSSRASGGSSSMPATSDTYSPTSPFARWSITTLPSGRAGRALSPTSGPRSISAATRPWWLITPSNAGGARGTRERKPTSVTRRTAESGSAYRLPPCKQMTARMASLQPEPRDYRLQLDGKVGQLLRGGGDGGGHHRLLADGARDLFGALGIRRGDLADLADGFHHLVGTGQLLLGGVGDGRDARRSRLRRVHDLVEREGNLGQVLAALPQLVDAFLHRRHGVLAALADLLRQPADLLRGTPGGLRQLAHLVGDHGEAAAVLAGAG